MQSDALEPNPTGNGSESGGAGAEFIKYLFMRMLRPEPDLGAQRLIEMARGSA